MHTTASGVEEAVTCVRIAIGWSGGWRDSPEKERGKVAGDVPLTTVEALEIIFQRPAMYWGNHANHFHGFVAFTNGYSTYQWGRDAKGYSPLDKMIPKGFSEFVAEHFGENPHSTAGWPFVIERHSKSGPEALELFLKLRKLYEEKHAGS